jgi:hypothetical protein
MGITPVYVLPNAHTLQGVVGTCGPVLFPAAWVPPAASVDSAGGATSKHSNAALAALALLAIIPVLLVLYLMYRRKVLRGQQHSCTTCFAAHCGLVSLPRSGKTAGFELNKLDIHLLWYLRLQFP